MELESGKPGNYFSALIWFSKMHLPDVSITNDTDSENDQQLFYSSRICQEVFGSMTHYNKFQTRENEASAW